MFGVVGVEFFNNFSVYWEVIFWIVMEFLLLILVMWMFMVLFNEVGMFLLMKLVWIGSFWWLWLIMIVSRIWLGCLVLIRVLRVVWMVWLVNSMLLISMMVLLVKFEGMLLFESIGVFGCLWCLLGLRLFWYKVILSLLIGMLILLREDSLVVMCCVRYVLWVWILMMINWLSFLLCLMIL